MKRCIVDVCALTRNQSLLQISARLAELRQQLPGISVERLVAAEPAVLRADIPAALADIGRLLPDCAGNPAAAAAVLAADPASVLDMKALGLESSVEVEGVQIQ